MEVTTRVNVGIGATNPAMKLRNFIMGADALGKMYGPTLAQGTNFEEVCKEVFSLLGYKDGKRFFTPQFDPRVAQLQQQVQQLQQKGHAAAGGNPQQLQTAQVTAQSRLQEQQIKSHTDIQTAQIDAQAKQQAEDAENWRTMMKMMHEASMKGLDHGHDKHMQMTAPQPAPVMPGAQ
jgi:hypothetical protein